MTRINERAAPTSKTGNRHFILGIRKPLDLKQLTGISFGLMRLRSNASSPALAAFAMNHGTAKHVNHTGHHKLHISHAGAASLVPASTAKGRSFLGAVVPHLVDYRVTGGIRVRRLLCMF
ncbi:hypothetical protein [Arthrobacter sp. B2a2-09]|uniref:hypothetical protein n=1 Tax=Arthrobacter sp. B2a2-09 TaxID=2952822 RepID=UPI0022CDAD62|nr:hypothetical protein [Arthrobacter sp. B2a2-09]